MKVLVKTCLLLTISVSAAFGAEELRLAGNLESGPHPVGFRTETLRISPPSAPQSVPVEPWPSAVELYVWYPAAGDGSTGSRMVFADYYRAQEGRSLGDVELHERLLDDMTSPPGVDDADLGSVLTAPMWAMRDAPADDARHPLVLWSYRDSVPTMQTLLNEYLASHGYVVAFAWPVDNAPPFPWEEGLTETQKSEALDTQTRLLEDVLDVMRTRPGVDAGSTSVLAWSYGGESAGALQRRRADVDVVVGIDATLVSGWVYRSVEALADLDGGELSAPYALLRNGRPRIDAPTRPEPALLREVRAGSWFVEFPYLSHGNFNFPGGMIPGILNLEEVSSWAVGGDAARLGYEMICRHVRGLLDHEQRGLPGDSAQWSASAPEGFVRVVRHRP